MLIAQLATQLTLAIQDWNMISRKTSLRLNSNEQR